MSRQRAAALAVRQQMLLVRSAELRGRLAADAAVLQRPLAAADRVRTAWRWLQYHPAAPLTALVVVVILRPRRALRWSLQAWSAWRAWRQLKLRLQAIA